MSFMKNRERILTQMESAKGCLTTEDLRRCSGRTTGIALAVIGRALNNPGREVPYADHHPRGNDGLRDTIWHCIKLLGLEGLVMDGTKKYTLRYDL